MFSGFIPACSFTQLCLTLCDPMDCSPPGSSIHEFSRQGYWSGLPFLPPGNLPNPGIESTSLASPALANGFFITVPSGKPKTDLPQVPPKFELGFLDSESRGQNTVRTMNSNNSYSPSRTRCSNKA